MRGVVTEKSNPFAFWKRSTPHRLAVYGSTDSEEADLHEFLVNAILSKALFLPQDIPGHPPMSIEHDNTEAMKYIRSLRDAVKRRFAVTYLEWIRAGRLCAMPNRGILSPALARAVRVNLDALG